MKVPGPMARLCLAVAALAACHPPATAPPPAAPPTARAAPPPAAEQRCVQLYTRNRTCTADYIPMMVELRAKYDRPPGLAAELAADRARVIAMAMEEWTAANSDPVIAYACAKIASAPDPDLRLDAAPGCLDRTDCARYIACIRTYFEKHIAKQT
jgi:hypothetical protein